MTTEILTSLEQLEALRTEWSELWQSCPHATTFQSPTWLIPWWKHLGEGELHVLVTRDRGQLLAMAPFFIRTLPDSGERQLLLLGTGISDYLDVLSIQECEEGLSAIWDALNDSADEWDTCDFQQLRPSSPLLRFEPLEDLQANTNVQEVCPVLTLSPKGALADSVPGHMLAKLRYYRRRACKCGAVEIEEANHDNLAQLFGAFVQMHTARWRAHGQSGGLAAVPLRDFHKEASVQLLANGMLRLYALRINGHIGACLYCFSHRQRMLYYLSGFAPDWASLSPGTVLIGHAIEQAIREQMREFDFLRGAELYKYMWGAADHFNHRRRIRRRAAVFGRPHGNDESRHIPGLSQVSSAPRCIRNSYEKTTSNHD